MKPRTLILMVVAIACGLVASYMTSRVIADRSKESEEEKVAVLVARQNLAMATHIIEPEKLFEEKLFTKGEEPRKAIRDFAQLKDRWLNKPLSAEAFVTLDDLDEKGKAGLAAMMTPGMRAVAIKVTADSSVAGFVQPLTRVDIMSVVQRGDNETYAKIILQNVLVLAVDQINTRDSDKAAVVASTVTVEVTPDQSEKHGLAMQLGTLRLALRSFGDEDKVTKRGATPKGLTQAGNDMNSGIVEPIGEGGRRTARTLSLPKVPDAPGTEGSKGATVAKAPEPPEPKTHTMVIMNGDQVTKAVFTLDDDPAAIKINKSQPDVSPAPRPGPASKDTKQLDASPAPRPGPAAKDSKPGASGSQPVKKAKG